MRAWCRLMTLGVLFALAAGLMWGLVFVAPLLLPSDPPALLAVGRYLAFGLIALPLAWLDRKRLLQLTRSDWWQALKLSLIGNLLYYTCLAAAIQHAGAPLPTMIIGTLPVVIAISSNLWLGEGERLAWSRLVPSLLLIGAGIACVNVVELEHLRSAAVQGTAPSLRAYVEGAGLAVLALICWTIYPMLNARWLRQHRDRSPSTWATAQGLATLPLALIGYLVLVGLSLAAAATHPASTDVSTLLLGATPARFILLMLAMGLFASWLGTLCWNEASQRLPTALSGQLIVFETLAALAYALVLRGEAPPLLTLVGAALLMAGVVWALRGGTSGH
jgi:drug/metabolite transporter (DMT)-like permease